MSRKQFLTELSQYLTFVSPEQRDEILAYYDAMLDHAGQDGESKLLQEIGTPMTVAIMLKRRLEANEPLLPEISEKIDTPYFVKFRRRDLREVGSDHGDEEGQEHTPDDAPDDASEDEDDSRAEESPQPETVSETEDALQSEEAFEAEKTEESEAAPVSGEDPEPAESTAAVSEEGASAKAAKSQSKPPVTFGRVMTAAGIVVLSLVIVAFFSFIAAIGGIVFASAVDIIISGFDSTIYLSDKLMIFGSGSLIMALGILLTWLAIWAAIRLIVSMVRGFNRTASPEKNALKTFWKIIWIIISVLVAIAIICCGVSLCLGGDPMILGGNEALSKMLSRLSPSTFVNFLKDSGLLG